MDLSSPSSGACISRFSALQAGVQRLLLSCGPGSGRPAPAVSAAPSGQFFPPAGAAALAARATAVWHAASKPGLAIPPPSRGAMAASAWPRPSPWWRWAAACAWRTLAWGSPKLSETGYTASCCRRPSAPCWRMGRGTRSPNAGWRCHPGAASPGWSASRVPQTTRGRPRPRRRLRPV